MKTSLRLLTFIFVIVIFNGVSLSQEYLVGVENVKYYPYYTIEGDEYKGYARDVLDAFAKEKGYTFKYKPTPIKRLFSDLVKKKIDFKFPDNKYWQADLKKGIDVSYSESVVDYIDGVMVLPDQKGKGTANLKKLGIVMGFTAWEYLGLIEKGDVKISESTNFAALLKRTIANKNNGAYINPSVANYQLSEVLKQPGSLVFDPDLPHTKSAYSLSSSKHPEIIKEFNVFLQSNKTLIDTLQEKYNIKLSN